MLRKRLKFIFIFFVFCLVGAGVFYFFNTQKEEVQASLNSEEQSLVILNPHSNPEVGDNWTVSFETKGIADLTIIPQDQATIDDLDFVSLTCNGQKRSPQILENDVIFYPNWFCDGQSKITHLVKITGKHTLKFQFRDETVWAYNNPNFYLAHKAAITGEGSPNYLNAAHSLYISGNYAYVASYIDDALSVFDISDVANSNITLKATTTGAGPPNYLNRANSVYVSGNYAYVVCDTDDALTVFDISDVANGNITHKAAITGAGSPNYLDNPYSVYVSGDYAYVVSHEDDALTVFDISDVANGNITLQATTTGAGYPNYLNSPYSVYISGNYAYVASEVDHALTVFDISDVANGNITHKVAIRGTGSPNYLKFARSVHVSGDYAYVTSYGDDALTVFDISDVANDNITHKAAITGINWPNYLDSPYSVYVSGNYAYVISNSEDALTVFDISDVANGNITNKAVLTGAGSPNYLGGVYSVYVSGNYAYVASYGDDALTVFYASTTPLGALINGYESHDTSVSTSSPGTEASTDYYQKVLDDDAYRWRTALSTTEGGYDSQVFKFQPDFTGISNPKITISWNGYGEADTGYNVYLNIWNFNNSSWEQLDSAHCSTDCNLSGYQTGTNYKDASDYVWAWVKADNEYSPPTISNVSSGTPTYNSASITWDTDISADAIVAYDTTSHSSGSWEDYAKFDNDEGCSPCANSSAEGGEAGNTSHSISLTGLNSNTTYYYRVRSAGTDGDKVTSIEYSFATAVYSCPFVYSWDGNNYIFDNEGLTRHHFSMFKGSEYTRLPSIKPVDSEFKIKITEEKLEDTYLDYVNLVRVKHDKGVEVYSGWLNKFYTIENPQKPIKAVDDTGKGVSYLLEKDDMYWNYNDFSGTDYTDSDGDGFADSTNPEDLLKYLELTFDMPKNAATVKLLLRPKQLLLQGYIGRKARALMEKYGLFEKHISFTREEIMKKFNDEVYSTLLEENATIEHKMIKVFVWNGTKWLFKSIIYDRPESKGPDVVYPLDISDIKTETLKIRFQILPNIMGLDYVLIDYSDDKNIEIEPIPLISAFKNGKDTLSTLVDIDQKELIIKSGEEVDLLFKENNNLSASRETTYFIELNGYYRIYDTKYDLDFSKSETLEFFKIPFGVPRFFISMYLSEFFSSYPGQGSDLPPHSLNTDKISVIVEEAPANQAPTNGTGSITDMDDTDNLYAQRKWYTGSSTFSDADGFANIDYCEFRLKQGATTTAIFRYDEDTNTFSIESGSTEWDLATSGSSAAESGNDITITWKFTPQWDATPEDDLEIELYVIDAAFASSTDVVQTNYVDVVTDLVTTFSIDDDRGNVGQSITATGTVTYAIDPATTTPSTNYPPDEEFNLVKVYDSANDIQGTTTVANSDWSINFNATSTVGIETYNLYIDMVDADYPDGEETSPTDTFITDQIEIVSVAFDDSRINIGGSAEVRYVLRYDYDDVPFDNAKGTVTGFTWDGINFWWDKSITNPSSVTSTNYDEQDISFTDPTYGITVIEDDAGANIITDRIKILTISAFDAIISIKTQGVWYTTAELEYDHHNLGSGDSFILSGYSFSWNAADSRFRATDTKDTSQIVTVNAYDSGFEATYGITAGNINGLSQSIEWYAVGGGPTFPPVSVTGQGNISQNLGGQVSQTFESGKLAKVVFPSQSIKGTVMVKIEPKDKIETIKANPLPQNTQIIGDLVADFKALSKGKELESFEKEASITFTYTDSQIKEVKIDEKTIKIYWWNKSTEAWQSLKSEVNTLTNTVTAHTIHFTLFAVMGETEEKPIEEIPAIAYEGIPAGFTFEKKLKYGDENDDVKYLQIILKTEVPEIYPAEVSATGWFGPITKASVISFQEKYPEDILTPWDLTEGTGYVGSTTRAKLNSLLAAVPTEEKEVTPEISEIPADYKFTADLKYDQTSDDVRYLQTFLKAQGKKIYPEGIVSGWFGPLTKKAVIRFQEKYASDILTPWELTEGTGFVGSTTRSKINEILGR